MPLMIDGGRVPTRWLERQDSRRLAAPERFGVPADSIRIAFINNMPDPALEDTEMQFFELLEATAGELPVSVGLYSLPGVLRGERARQHLNSFYSSLDDLLNGRYDGVIITGTEPRRPDLREEPYWQELTAVFDWGEYNTNSTVLSCLAAHAGVLHSDGIQRHPLNDKQFGVFDFRKPGDHLLTMGAPDQIRFPHSRWNEVQGEALTSCGYSVLSQSADAGVDLFVKRKKSSLFVHFQGHPEYGARTLMKEYRRDIRRFLGRERETYPTMPHGYFDAAATEILSQFREKALSDRREDLMGLFPEAPVVETLQSTWHSSAMCVYRNWLQYLQARKSDVLVFAPVSRLGRARSTPANREI